MGERGAAALRGRAAVGGGEIGAGEAEEAAAAEAGCLTGDFFGDLTAAFNNALPAAARLANRSVSQRT